MSHKPEKNNNNDASDDDDTSKAETSSTMTAPSVSSNVSGRNGSDSLNATQHEIRRTNVEVCIRVRPLVVSTTPQRYFDTSKQQQSNTPPRRTSRLVRPSSSKLPPRSPAIGIAKRKAPLPNFRGDDASPEPDMAMMVANDDSTVAWEVVPEDPAATTVQQHFDTRIPGRTHSYTLDRVFGPTSTTQEMYQQSVRPLVESTVLEGYHSSVFCYGQTSTGKTFTMTGTKQSPGLLPLAVQDVFHLCRQHQDGHMDREYLLRVSYVEIYNEQVIDLLSPNSSTVIRILEHPTEGVVVRGLREEVVSTPEQVFALLRAGETRRQVGSTNMNKHSSRSHAIFRLTVESSRCGAASRQRGSVRVSSLSLVDLAGSESVRLSGATGDRRKEGQYINKSLMTLGQVVFKLSEWKRQQDGAVNGRPPRHIPYRDSKLTRLLQPSLSGNAQIVMICNISPQLTHMEESHNTLKFALRAKKIEQHARVTEVTDDKTLLQSYREEISELKSQLEQAREAQRRLEEQTSQRVVDNDDDTREIEEAIAKMEKLILKTKSPAATPQVGRSDLDNEEDELLNILSDDTEVENHAPSTPARTRPENGLELVSELHRIQGLLGSALTRRKIFASPPRRDEEMEQLRTQLHEKEVSTSLKMADSSFLENQLVEKDNLLAEVSKILEAIEKRQGDLEAEAMSLKHQLAKANEALVSERQEKEYWKRRLDQVEQAMEDREVQRVTKGIAYHP